MFCQLYFMFFCRICIFGELNDDMKSVAVTSPL